MIIQYTLLTDAGGLEENQDYAGATSSLNGVDLYSVADGLGGHGGGALASRLAVEAVLMRGQDGVDFSPQGLSELLQSTQDDLHLHQQQNPDLVRMRTTLVLLMLQDQQALWLHVGDSRLYQFRDNAVIFQTKDHSVPQMLAASGDITAQEIRNHPDRNRLLRALGGDTREAKATLLKSPVDLRAGDAFLLCTDGFWELILEEEMVQTLQTAPDLDHWLQAMEAVVLSHARGNFDNYTALGLWALESDSE